MAYIHEFTVQGLAGRKATIHRQLDRHVNVFWGLNGTGKTSLLKILHSALRNDVSALKDVPFLSARVMFFSTDHNALLERTIEWGTDVDPDGDDSDDDDDEYSVEVQPDGTIVEIRTQRKVRNWATSVIDGKVSHGRDDIPFRHAYLPISRMSQVGRRVPPHMRNAAIDDAFLDKQFAGQVQGRWQYYNSEANSRIRAIQQQGLASILAHLFGGGFGGGSQTPGTISPEEAYALVHGFLRQQRISLRFGQAEFLRRYEGDIDLQRVVANIKAVSEEVRETLRPQEEFQEVIASLYSGDKRLQFDTHHSAAGRLSVEVDGQAIPLRSLSSGEKQLLRLMLEALAADAGTVMIDEPELSMHVDWQQVLVESMRRVNPECQLLLATHSPEIMAEVPDDLVFEL